MYPLSEMCREDGAIVDDLVVQIVNLNENAEEDVDLRDDLFLLLLPTLDLWLGIDLHLARDGFGECDILPIESHQ